MKNCGLVQGAWAKDEPRLSRAARLAATPEGLMLTAGICGNSWQGVERCAAVPSELPKNTPAPVWFETHAKFFVVNHARSEELFRPSSLVVDCTDGVEMLQVARSLEGSLMASLHLGWPRRRRRSKRSWWTCMRQRRARDFHGYPTGLEVSHAIVHAGPYPATSDGGRNTSVDMHALNRWTWLICYQSFADELLPPELQNANPLELRRLVMSATTEN